MSAELMTTSLTTSPVGYNAPTVTPEQIMRALNLDPRKPEVQALVLVCQRYDLDPLLKHALLILTDSRRPVSALPQSISVSILSWIRRFQRKAFSVFGEGLSASQGLIGIRFLFPCRDYTAFCVSVLQ